MTNPTTTDREIEELSEKIHKLYCAQYLKDNGRRYWTNGDYSALDEKTKEYDRNIARFILADRSQLLKEERQRTLKGARKKIEKLKRTDDTRYHADFLHDEALDEALAALSELEGEITGNKDI